MLNAAAMTDLFKPSATRSWALLLSYVAMVLLSLPFTRGLVLTLRGLDLISAVVGVLYAVALVGVAYYLVFSVDLSDRVAFAAVAGTGGITAALLMGVQFPEERVHFMQYALMAGLAAAALRWHSSPALAYLGAVMIAAGIGCFDEILQDVLPNRVYDIKDIIVNAQGAILGVVADEAVHNRLHWHKGPDDVAHPDRG